jgi:hypothetical protein
MRDQQGTRRCPLFGFPLIWPFARTDTEIAGGKRDPLGSRRRRTGGVNLLSTNTAQLEPIRVIPVRIYGCPPSGPVGRLEVEQTEAPDDLCLQLCPKRSKVRPVARRDPHHLFGKDVKPELLALARRNIVGREMDPHHCARSMGARGSEFTMFRLQARPSTR